MPHVQPQPSVSWPRMDIWHLFSSSTCACCLLSAICAAIILCLPAMRAHLAHIQSRHRQYLLCPWKMLVVCSWYRCIVTAKTIPKGRKRRLGNSIFYWWQWRGGGGGNIVRCFHAFTCLYKLSHALRLPFSILYKVFNSSVMSPGGLFKLPWAWRRAHDCGSAHILESAGSTRHPRLRR